MGAVSPLPGLQQRILHRVFEVLASQRATFLCAEDVAHLGRGKGVGIREGRKRARPVVLGILGAVEVARVRALLDSSVRTAHTSAPGRKDAFSNPTEWRY